MVYDNASTMKYKFILATNLLCIFCQFSAILHAQSIGVGTTAPLDKLHIANGDLLLENGKFTTTKTGRGRNLAPIAIASVSANGNLVGGTGNVAASGFGTIVDIGEDNAGTQAFATAISATQKLYGVVNPMAAPNNTKIEVKFYDFNGFQYYPAYSLIVYKTGTDAYREYNITLKDNANGVVITHGTYGISTAAVDSISINILIPDTVLIGGGSSTGAAITINGLPAKASVKITNRGKIVGMGGSGSSGDGTYSVNGFQGSCYINGGPGFQGGSAIVTATKIIVDNYGFIAGGGGGGGGGKRGAATNANGGGGGAGAGWPIPAAGSGGFGDGGRGGGTWFAVGQGGSCAVFTTCNNPSGCCCGSGAPYATNGQTGSYTSGINFTPGQGGAGINGGFGGLPGGLLGNPGQASANTTAGSVAGKAVETQFGSTATGNIVNTLSGGQTIGVVQ